LLVRHFAELFSRRINKVITTISPETMGALTHYDWPGNIRELQNVIERAVILSSRGALRIAPGDLQPHAHPSPQVAKEKPPTGKRIRTMITPLDRDQVLNALRQARGRVGRPAGAAARLGLKRTTLIAQMKRLGIDPRTVIGSL
jgi:DNA-binding NtrC family response regulator